MRFFCCLLGVVLLGAGCATKSTVQTRRTERSTAYSSLPAEERALVDQGKIRAGMTEDAVYIAWGKPNQVLQSGDAAGEATTWLYHGTTTDEYVYWNQHDSTRRDGSGFSDRYLDRTYDFRDYIRAELHFRAGRLETWRMLPKPPERTLYSP